MPYTVDSKDLPKNILAMDAKKREAWVNTWNGVFAQCEKDGGEDCEARAFKMANGAAKMTEDVNENILARTLIPIGEEQVSIETLVNSFQEAATIKAMAKGLMRDIVAILADRTIPDVLRKEIEDVRAALRRTWADLETDGQPIEPVTVIPNEVAMGEVEIVSLVNRIIEERFGKVPVIEVIETEQTETEIVIQENEEPAVVDFKESGTICEVIADGNTNLRAPIRLRTVLIEPGAGNSRDNHYYPADVLRRDAHVFEGCKGHLVDHDDAKRTAGTEVSVVEAIEGFTPAGAPIGRMLVYDPYTCEKVRNLASVGQLGLLPFSILGAGRSRKGKVDGKDYQIVETIESGRYVDWVTRAGAGGRAIGLAEAATEEVETLDAKSILIKLLDSGLPINAMRRLAEGSYENDEQLDGAIASMKELVQELQAKPAEKPIVFGNTEPVAETKQDDADLDTRLAGVFTKHGIHMGR